MKYFIDTEFIEGFKKPLFGKRRHFIDLISIGIVCEDGRSYYAISNEFKREDADEWVNKNVIDKIEAEMFQKQSPFAKTYFNFGFKDLLKQFGKSNKQIAQEVFQFCTDDTLTIEKANYYNVVKEGIEFYGYYSDYDWVVFCSLFGRMIDLPKGFPMYCKDLKQMFDETFMPYNRHTVKTHPSYPKQSNEHNALDDAKWNFELYKFLQNL